MSVSSIWRSNRNSQKVCCVRYETLNAALVVYKITDTLSSDRK